MHDSPTELSTPPIIATAAKPGAPGINVRRTVAAMVLAALAIRLFTMLFMYPDHLDPPPPELLRRAARRRVMSLHLARPGQGRARTRRLPGGALGRDGFRPRGHRRDARRRMNAGPCERQQASKLGAN